MVENKTGKYLKYAVGEIVLVVIGILIALQINNWNELEKSKQDERILLSNLRDEFVFNRNEYEKTETALNTHINTLETLIRLFGSKKETVNLRYLDSLLYGSFFSPSAETSEGVYLSITNSGKIDILSNPKLKSLLLSWGSERNNFKIEEGNMYQNLNRNVVPRLEERISFQNLEKFGKIKGIQDSKLMQDNREVLNDFVAENIFFNHLWELNNVLEIYPSMYKLLDEIIVELEK